MSYEYTAQVPSGNVEMALAALKGSLHHLAIVEIVRENLFSIAFRFCASLQEGNWLEDASISASNASLVLAIHLGKDREKIVQLVTSLARNRGLSIEFEEE